MAHAARIPMLATSPGPDGVPAGRILVGGDGQAVSLAAIGGAATAPGGIAAGTSTGASAGTSAGTAGDGTSSPFVINITYGASVAAAPAGFVAGVQAAVQYLESRFSDPVSINITVGYGEVAGTAMVAGALGSSLTYMVRTSYAALAAALAGDASTASDAAALAALPATDPATGGAYWVSTANARALGLLGPSTATDGYVGFASQYAFDVNPADGIAAGSYDFFGVAVHELTEVMGRMLLAGGTIGGTANGYDPLDLFHYAAPGVRDLSATAAGYFSADGGAGNLGAFNTRPGGDAGDWASAGAADAFNAFSAAGVVNGVSAADLTMLDLIGWDAVTPAAGVAVPAPDGIGITAAALPAAAGLAGGLVAGAAIATLRQSGGPAADSYAISLGGPAAGQFALADAGGGAALLRAGAAGLAGAANGAVYRLSAGVTDTTSQAAGPATPLAVIVGAAGADTIGVAARLGATDIAAFIHGLGGNDTLNGAGMTAALWFAGGAGADVLTGGAGQNVYQYGAAADSTARAMDTITNFHAGTDLIDLTGLGVGLAVAGPLAGGRLAAGSVGWQAAGGTTFVYVNTSTHAERLGAADMRIALTGNIPLTAASLLHL